MAPKSKLPAKNSQDHACIIPMKKDYLVSLEDFDIYAEPTVRNSRRWRNPDLDLVSYKPGVLTLKAMLKSESFTLVFQMEPEHLKIRCSCRECGPKLCEHVYYALQRMIWHSDSDYFKELKSGGPIDFAHRHRNWCRTEWRERRIYVSSRNRGVHVFGFDPLTLPQQLTTAIALEQNSPADSKSDQGLTYVITMPFKNRWMPAVFPCLGKLTKAGDKIKGFQNYLTGIGKNSDHMLTERQKVLNLLLLELYREVELLPGQIRNMSETEMIQLVQAFRLWRQAFAFLLAEAYVYATRFYGPRFLRGKPEKQRTYKLLLSHESPKPAFRLMKKPNHYELSLFFDTGTGKLTAWGTLTPFYLQAGEKLFVWDSVHDASVAEWFPKEGKMVITKDRYATFNSEVLAVLKQRYTIVSSTSKI